MAKEFYSNAAIGFLSGALTDSATSVNLVSGSMFPSSGNYTLKCDDEIMLVTARSSNTLTVTRGQEGTTGAAHSDNAPIYSVLTDGSLRRLVRQSHGGTLAGARREVNFVDSASVTWTLTDDGTNDKVDVEAVASATGGNLPWESSFTTPSLGSFTWVNQGSATATSYGNTIFARAPAAGGSNAKLLQVSAPGTPWSAVAKIIPANTGSNYNTAGLFFRQSSDGKLETLSLYGSIMQVNRYTDASTYSSNLVAIPTDSNSRISWYKIGDNGTNRTYSISADGINWTAIYSAGRTDYLTADKVGFFVEANSSSYDACAILASWAVS